MFRGLPTSGIAGGDATSGASNVSVFVSGIRRLRSRRTLWRSSDSGQARFWQIGLGIVILVVLAFDLGSPQVVKAQLSDRAKSAAIDASQVAVRAAASTYNQKFAAVCDTVRRRLDSYGATLIPPNPDSDCPGLDMDGTVTFSAEKEAPSLVLKYLGLRSYYRVRIDVQERYSGGL
jgi:hypothetical protein